MVRMTGLTRWLLFMVCQWVTSAQTETSMANCLCIFDIDRTLTGKQGTAGDECPNDKAIDGIWDAAYSGGVLTLSALSVQGINSTFCRSCYLGIISAGGASGHDSKERAYFEDNILLTHPFTHLTRTVPSAKAWSHSPHFTSPLVVYQADRTKQIAVVAIVDWYKSNSITIANDQVHFFGDRTENIEAFRGSGFNAREVSCNSRDWSMGGVVGLCGATPAEVVDSSGVYTCEDITPAPTPAPTPTPLPTRAPNVRPSPPAIVTTTVPLQPAPLPVTTPGATPAPSHPPTPTTLEPLPASTTEFPMPPTTLPQTTTVAPTPAPMPTASPAPPPGPPATTPAPQAKCGYVYCPKDWACCGNQCYFPGSTCCGHWVCSGGWSCYGGQFCLPSNIR
mmetsp:Transcript_19334/g.40253  ORF Transcript_19334/g.40253 Transcript_19334/m.40253 type:complete len:392 (-) Transcript_19334:286-1461(-)